MPSAYRRSYRLQAHLVQQAHAVVIGCNYSSIPRFERKGYISLMAPRAIGVDWSGVSVFVP